MSGVATCTRVQVDGTCRGTCWECICRTRGVGYGNPTFMTIGKRPSSGCVGIWAEQPAGSMPWRHAAQVKAVLPAPASDALQRRWHSGQD